MGGGAPSATAGTAIWSVANKDPDHDVCFQMFSQVKWIGFKECSVPCGRNNLTTDVQVAPLCDEDNEDAPLAAVVCDNGNRSRS